MINLWVNSSIVWGQNICIKLYYLRVLVYHIMNASESHEEHMVNSMRILFLTSHVGLGHAARDVAVVNALRRLGPDLIVEWCSAEPASSFFEALGEKPAKGCSGLRSFSRVIEDLYNGNIRGIRDLGSRLSILKYNYELIRGLVEDNLYDLVFADEFWELMYSAPVQTRSRIVFGTDLVYKPYSLKPVDSFISLVLNHYFKRNLPVFRRLIYMNDPDILDDYRWYWFMGGKVREWVHRYMHPVGLVTSYLYDELPDKETARRRLGIGDDTALITVSVGGTSAGNRDLLECLDRSIPVIYGDLKVLLDKEVEVRIITGPRTIWKPKNGLINVVRGVQPRLLDYYVASDLFVARAGRTTTADLYCAGRPAVFIPIRNHFEQVEIAKYMNRKHGYPILYEEECGPRALYDAVRKAMSMDTGIERELCRGAYKAAEILYEDMVNR